MLGQKQHGTFFTSTTVTLPLCPHCRQRQKQASDPSRFVVGFMEDGYCNRCGYKERKAEPQSVGGSSRSLR